VSNSPQIPITWASKDQYEIFQCRKRFIVLRCGRRWGKTKGALHRMMRIGIRGKNRKALWVDTTQANIQKYFDEHIATVLPSDCYHFDKRAKVLKFTAMGSITHFGSAERPANLEGFGYHDIYLNEAGIILKGESGERLWRNTIRPMAMEHKAKVWFIGTPKGLGLFKDFSDRGESDDPKWKDWATYHRASFDREGISQEEIDQIIAETPGGEQSQTFRQEILAEFLETDEGDPVVPYERGREALGRELEQDLTFKVIWGVDPSGVGDDAAGLCKRRYNRLVEPTKIRSGQLDSQQGAAWIRSEYENTEIDDRPEVIVVDVSNVGDGWVTHARQMGLPVMGYNWALKSENTERYPLMRDQLWFKASEWCVGGSLAGDEPLMRELVKPLIDIDWLDDKGKLKVESKKKMRARLKKEGSSPNRADAFVLTFAVPDGPTRKRRDTWRVTAEPDLGGRTWMST